MSRDINKVLVIGAGTMGAGIAEVCAKAGCQVSLQDVQDDFLDRGKNRIEASLDKAVAKQKIEADAAAQAKARVTYTKDADGGHDLIVEAVPENMDLKKMILQAAAQKNDGAIVASNTSSLSVTEIAAACPNPEGVIGLHFFNPVAIMPLLEIVRAQQTTQALVDECRAFGERLGKSPIVVRDVPGFASSRLGIILGMEAIRMLEMQVASAADIDGAMKLGYRHPMGPLELTDLVGLDVRLNIAEHLTKEIGPQFTPPPLLRQLVRAGKLGKKSGEGFYKWVDGKAQPKD